ncbi:MAG: 1-phosphofructokinase family hexose kinase [Fimbriimonadaceae bacterium]
MILSVTLNPSLDHALFVDKLKLNDTNRAVKCFKDAGGKGVNLSRVVAELGGESVATGFLGGGPGSYIRAVLDKQSVAHEFVEVEGDTRVNFSVEDTSELPPTTFNEPGPLISEARMEELMGVVQRLAVGSKWVCLGGSLPPSVPKSIYGDIVDALPNAKIALDADGEPLTLGLRRRVGLLKPNGPEAERLFGRQLETQTDLTDAVRWLGERAEFAFISRGEQGAVLAAEGEVWWGITPNVVAQSTIGSGDSFIAGFLWSLTSGHSVEVAFRWALAAGAATAMTDGSEIGRKHVIEKLFDQASVSRTG